MIMKKSAFMLLIILLSLTANAQTPYRNEDGKKIDKEELETKDYLPEIHGTIRTKFEYQTEMAASRFEVRNARISITGNVLPIVAYKAEIDLSDEGQIKMLDAYARLFPIKDLTVTAGQMRVPFTPTRILPNTDGRGYGLFVPNNNSLHWLLEHWQEIDNETTRQAVLMMMHENY